MMNRYKIYVIRRAVLADRELTNGIMRGALAVLETLDWNKVSKSFMTKRHLSSWIDTIAVTYDIEADDVNAGIDYMRAGGFLEYLTRPGQQSIVLTAAQVLDMVPA